MYILMDDIFRKSFKKKYHYIGKTWVYHFINFKDSQGSK